MSQAFLSAWHGHLSSPRGTPDPTIFGNNSPIFMPPGSQKYSGQTIIQLLGFYVPDVVLLARYVIRD